MISMTPRLLSAALLTTALGFSGCTLTDGGAGPSVPSNYGYDTVLVSVSANVIYPTYVDLAEKGGALQAAVAALDANPTSSTLAAARQAWRDARAPWERSEGFLFGPVDSKGIDPSIDSWPLDSITLKAVLTRAPDSLNLTFVRSQAEEVKGFHAIEYLLFGIDSTKTAAALTVNERAYLRAATAHFKERVDTLQASWNPAGGNFLGDFQTAGTGSTVYTSRRAAAEELLDGMIAICDEVANGKITDPFNDGAAKEESRFSRNSTADFANNLRSVRNVYLGIYGNASTGRGVKEWVRAADVSLSLRVEAEIDSAISRIEQVGDFTAALSNSGGGRPKIEAARTAIQTLKNTLESRVKPAVLP